MLILRLLLLLGIGTSLVACASTSPLRSQSAPEGQSLTALVSELRVAMALDTYHFPRPRTSDGRDAVEVALWKLDRLQRERGVGSRDSAFGEPRAWTKTDLVVAFARGAALERLRRYAEAAEAYAAVAQHGSVLTAPAADSQRRAREFAALAQAQRDDLELESIERRIQVWQRQAEEVAGTRWEPLANEESEAWEMLRVEWLGRNADRPRVIEACARLLDRHRNSKLAPRHWIRLGDLYADAARERQMREHARIVAPDPADYDALLERAFAAYELAADSRHAPAREQAGARIEALLAWHEGGLRGAH